MVTVQAVCHFRPWDDWYGYIQCHIINTWFPIVLADVGHPQPPAVLTSENKYTLMKYNIKPLGAVELLFTEKPFICNAPIV